MRLWSEIDKVAFRDNIPISGACSILSSLLRTAARYVIVKTQKGNNRPQGVDLIGKVIMESPPQLAKVPGWFFYALKHYLINVKTNVRNTKMNVPKIRCATFHCRLSPDKRTKINVAMSKLTRRYFYPFV